LQSRLGRTGKPLCHNGLQNQLENHLRGGFMRHNYAANGGGETLELTRNEGNIVKKLLLSAKTVFLCNVPTGTK